MAELFGRVDGTSGGRGGSMHIFDLESRFMGGYGIVGGNLPLAAGLALASDYKGEDSVTVCMFGDGASNTGNFGETMNLAALWELPVVFLVENNLYGMGTSVERHSALTDLSQKAEGYGVPGERVDGMDVLAVREAVAEHIRIAREERRPTLVEAFTYRFRGHSAADPEVYRAKEEVEEWRTKDPIETFARRAAEERSPTRTRARSAARPTRGSSRRSLSPTPRPSRRSTRSMTTSTWSRDDPGWYAVDERAPKPFRASASAEASQRGEAAGRGGRRLRWRAVRAAAQAGRAWRCRRRRRGARSVEEGAEEEGG